MVIPYKSDTYTLVKIMSVSERNQKFHAVVFKKNLLDDTELSCKKYLKLIIWFLSGVDFISIELYYQEKETHVHLCCQSSLLVSPFNMPLWQFIPKKGGGGMTSNTGFIDVIVWSNSLYRKYFTFYLKWIAMFVRQLYNLDFQNVWNSGSLISL